MSTSDAIAGLGTRSDHVALAPMLDRSRLRLSAEESRVLDAIGRVAPIGEVLARSGLPEAQAISLLLGLRVKGAVVPARGPARTISRQDLDAALLESVDLDEARKRELLDLERNFVGMNHFEVLGLPAGADREEVKRAYHEASRRYHPDRYYGKNLGSFKARIEKIFKRISEANQTLSDEPRRAAYLAQHPELAAPKKVAASPEEQRVNEERDAERRSRLAKHPYLVKGQKAKELVQAAKTALAAGDLARARTAVDQAAAIEPNLAEVRAVGVELRKKEAQRRSSEEVQKGNDALALGDTTRALESFRSACRIDPDNAAAAARLTTLVLKLGADPKDAKGAIQRACELEPKNAQYRYLLAQVHEVLGMKALAKRFFEETLQLDPNHAEAKAAMKKLRWPF